MNDYSFLYQPNKTILILTVGSAYKQVLGIVLDGTLPLKIENAENAENSMSHFPH